MVSGEKKIVELDAEDSEDPYREAMENRRQEEEASSDLPESPRLNEEYDESEDSEGTDGDEIENNWDGLEDGFDDPCAEDNELDEDARYAQGVDDDSDGD